MKVDLDLRWSWNEKGLLGSFDLTTTFMFTQMLSNGSSSSVDFKDEADYVAC